MPSTNQGPQVEKAVAGIAVCAQIFNPSIFTETWLVQNGIITPEAFIGLRVFSPEIVQFQTSIFQVAIIPPRLQFTLDGTIEPEKFNKTAETVSKIIRLLPQTPFQTLGLNADYFISVPADFEFNSFSRRLFGNGENKLLDEFAPPDAKFGRYFSKDWNQARLKLEIKPVQIQGDKKDLFQFSFNYHYVIDEQTAELRAAKLLQHIDAWEKARKYAEELLVLGITL